MNATVLLRAQSYNPGHDVWIVPRNDDSLLVRKMDWYVNFQLSRAAEHQSRPLSADLKSILSEHEMNLSSGGFCQPDAPLMLDAESKLPAKKLIEVTATDDHRQWAGKIHEIWVNLGRPSLRIFLPAGMEPEEFQSLWQGGADGDISIVPHSKI